MKLLIITKTKLRNLIRKAMKRGYVRGFSAGLDSGYDQGLIRGFQAGYKACHSDITNKGGYFLSPLSPRVETEILTLIHKDLRGEK